MLKCASIERKKGILKKSQPWRLIPSEQIISTTNREKKITRRLKIPYFDLLMVRIYSLKGLVSFYQLIILWSGLKKRLIIFVSTSPHILSSKLRIFEVFSIILKFHNAVKKYKQIACIPPSRSCEWFRMQSKRKWNFEGSVNKLETARARLSEVIKRVR